MTLDERTTRALASAVPLLTPAQYAELHLRVLMELRAEQAKADDVIAAAGAVIDAWADCEEETPFEAELNELARVLNNQ